jgi:hypothetical protein
MPSETSSENGWSGAVAQADLVQYQPWHCGEPHPGQKTTGTVPGGKRLAFPLRAV